MEAPSAMGKCRSSSIGRFANCSSASFLVSALLLNRAAILGATVRYAAAQRDLQRILRADPNNVEALFNLGIVLENIPVPTQTLSDGSVAQIGVDTMVAQSSVPEPSTLVLAGIACTMLVACHAVAEGRLPAEPRAA